MLSPRRSPLAAVGRARARGSSPNRRTVLWTGCLICVLVAEGMAVAHSYLLAAPLLGVLLVAVAVDIPLVPFLGVTLLVRVLADSSLSSPTIRHTGSLNVSGAIALVFILVAAGLLLRRRRGLWPTVAVALWLCAWTAIAAVVHGATTETVREGVREGSVVALAVLVCNSRGALNLPTVTRMVQVVGVGAALVALYQLGTHTGMRINGETRSNGTFIHPNGAAMYFAIATVASVWRYLDRGRGRWDAFFTATFAAATIATFSLSGLAGLLAMLMAFGALRSGSMRLKLGSFAVAGLIVVAFLATPVGSERIAKESATKIAFVTSRRAESTSSTSLAWRFYKWSTLIPEWEQAPYLGQGLGTTLTAEGNSENRTAAAVPHNEYLRYLVETGAVGLALLIFGAALLIRRLARRRELPGAPGAGALGVAIVAGCLVNAIADNTFQYTTTGYAAALILAAILCAPAGGRGAMTAIDAGGRR
jgi:O-antigen ligase